MSSGAEDNLEGSDELPMIEPFNMDRIVDLSEQRIRRRQFVRRVRYAGVFTVGLALGALALNSLGPTKGTGVDRNLVASAAFANLMGNDKEIRLTATGGKGRFGIAVGFRGNGPVVELNPGIGKHTRFGGPDQPATFLLPEAVTAIYLVVTDTPAEDVVRRFVAKWLEAGATFDDPAKTMDTLKEYLLGLGYSTLDIHKVNTP